jgi:hypothetical protein
MSKHLKLILGLVFVIMLFWVVPVIGQAPPPPAHGQDGNQASPAGTGCPLDQQKNIAMSLFICLGYAGLVLYRRSKTEGMSEEE